MGQAEFDQPLLEPFEATADDGTRLRASAGGSGSETVCYVAAYPTPPSMVLATAAGQALARELSKTRRVIFPAPRGSAVPIHAGLTSRDGWRRTSRFCWMRPGRNGRSFGAGGWADSSRSRTPVIIRSRYPGWCWTI